MTRKNSLLEISKAYEHILNETNISIDPSAQNTLLMNTMKPSSNKKVDEFEFTMPKDESEETAENMFAVSQQMDNSKQECPCDSGECPEEEEEGCDVADDSNFNMAKSEIFKVLNYAQDIMDLLKNKPKIEAWMLGKIVTTADYLCSIRGVLQYDEYENYVEKDVDDFSNDMTLVSKITQMLNGENAHVNEEVLKRAIFNLEILKSK